MLDAGAALQAGHLHTAVGVAHVQAHRAFIGNHAARAGEQCQAQAGRGFDRGLALHQLETLALRVHASAQAALRIQFDLQLRRRRDLQPLTGAGMEIGRHRAVTGATAPTADGSPPPLPGWRGGNRRAQEGTPAPALGRRRRERLACSGRQLLAGQAYLLPLPARTAECFAMTGISLAPRAEAAPVGRGGLARGQPHHPCVRLALDGIQRALRAIVRIHGAHAGPARCGVLLGVKV